jgi:hypothetical protein
MQSMPMLLIGIGGFAALCGLLVGIGRLRTLFAGCAAKGRVVAHERTSSAGSDEKIHTLLAPVVEFEHGGRKVRFRSTLAQSNAPAVGSTVTVRYLPADPQTSAEIAGFVTFWLFPIGALAVGLLLLAIGLREAGYFA